MFDFSPGDVTGGDVLLAVLVALLQAGYKARCDLPEYKNLT